MRKFIYHSHSWLGLIAGLGLLVVGITGSALVFKQEIDALVAPELVRLPDPSKPRLSHDAFLAKIQSELPDYRVAGWGKAPKPGLSDAVYAIPLGKTEGKLMYVDSTTGIPRNPNLEQNKTFTDWLLEIHYSFLGDHAGAFIVGIFGVVLFLLGCSGVYLYRGFWKTFFRLRWGKSARIFFSDFHKMVGITSTVFNLLLGFTGAWWNITHIVGHWIEDHPEPVITSTQRYWADGVSIDSMVAAARDKLPGYQANWITLPFTEKDDVMMFGSIDRQSVLHSPYGSIVVCDAKTGDVKSATSIQQAGIGLQILDSFRPLHYGNFGGIPVKILWSIGGLTPAILAITGTLMWWKRKFRS
ncbi:MAG: PepSY-associated TM helix domain-containing protein [Luteolibacter sp.]